MGLILLGGEGMSDGSAFEGPAKQSVQSVFDGVNSYTESLDILNKYKKST